MLYNLLYNIALELFARLFAWLYIYKAMKPRQAQNQALRPASALYAAGNYSYTQIHSTQETQDTA